MRFTAAKRCTIDAVEVPSLVPKQREVLAQGEVLLHSRTGQKAELKNNTKLSSLKA